MAILSACNGCGHKQMIGHNAVDGRVKWWTRCEACGKGNAFITIQPIPSFGKKVKGTDDE